MDTLVSSTAGDNPNQISNLLDRTFGRKKADEIRSEIRAREKEDERRYRFVASRREQVSPAFARSKSSLFPTYDDAARIASAMRCSPELFRPIIHNLVKQYIQIAIRQILSAELPEAVDYLVKKALSE
jgi:hypothetical protein